MKVGWWAVALANILAITPVSSQSSAVQHLPSGDSIAVIMAGPAVVPNRTPGLLVRFYPYGSLSDTTRLRDLALALWHQLVPRLDSVGISWLVLQATDQTPGPQLGVFRVHNYGFVFERGADSVWHRAAKPDSTIGAQADSAEPATPDLAGRWRVTGLLLTELAYLSLTQQGSQLRGEIVTHRNCLGKDVKVVVEFEGSVESHEVRLWSTNGRVEGEFINPCTDAVFAGQMEFQGQLAADGKKITGPIELSGVRRDTWTLAR